MIFVEFTSVYPSMLFEELMFIAKAEMSWEEYRKNERKRREGNDSLVTVAAVVS